MQDNEQPWTELEDGTAVRVYYDVKVKSRPYRVDMRRNKTPKELAHPGKVTILPPCILSRVFPKKRGHSVVCLTFLTQLGAVEIHRALDHLLALHHPNLPAPMVFGFGAYTEVRDGNGNRRSIQRVIESANVDGELLVGSTQITFERPMRSKELASIPEQAQLQWMGLQNDGPRDAAFYVASLKLSSEIALEVHTLLACRIRP